MSLMDEQSIGSFKKRRCFANAVSDGNKKLELHKFERKGNLSVFRERTGVKRIRDMNGGQTKESRKRRNQLCFASKS